MVGPMQLGVKVHFCEDTHPTVESSVHLKKLAPGEGDLKGQDGGRGRLLLVVCSLIRKVDKLPP